MSQEQVLDQEDQMSQALAEIRSERAEEPTIAVEAQAAPATEPTPAPDAAPAVATEPDPAEQLKALQAELHKFKSEEGRVSALNRKYAEASQEAALLREKIAQMEQQSAQAPATLADQDDKLAAIAEQVKDFPELAGIVSAVSDAIKQADRKAEEVARRVAAQVVEPLEPLRREQTDRIQNEQRASYDAALATFNSVYPTAVQVTQSDEFKGWLETQPSNIQYAYFKGQTPQEAMTVLDTYDMHLRRAGKTPIAQFTPTQAPAVAPAAPVRSAPDTSRLQRAAGLPSRASGAQGGQPPSDDFDGALAYFRTKRLNAAGLQR